MPVTITNLSPAPILIPLNSGGAIRVSPGTASGAIPDVDVKDNAKIEKLLSRRVISVEVRSEGEADASADAETEGRPRARKKS
jgi:hypothetical protein